MNRKANAGGLRPSLGIAIAALGLVSTIAIAQNDASLRPGANALLAIDQHRGTVIERIVSQWGDSIDPSGAQADVRQLRTILGALRADDLLAASLAGTAEGVRDVLATAHASLPKLVDGRVQTKALGETADDVVYTPVTPCRLVETRGTFAAVYQGGGAFSGGTTRTYTVQGGNGVCLTQLPAGLGASAVQLQLFGIPINSGASGDIEILPQGSTFGTTATEVYVGNVAFNTVSTTAKINLTNNQIAVQVRGGGANVAIDVVGYFKRPGNYVGTNTITGSGATIGGGENNTANGTEAFVGGGGFNTASAFAATVAGGDGNQASNQNASVVGGAGNVATGILSTVLGGSDNVAGGTWSIAAGDGSQALGNLSFAVGNGAAANEAGMFVWADSLSVPFSPTSFRAAGQSANTFNVRATGTGGVLFVTGVNASGAPTSVCYTQNLSGWTCTSDRNVKRNLRPVDSEAVLAKVVAMPVYHWQPKDGPNREVEHLGPMAQDFMAAFGLGNNDKAIGFQDADGVALAAIQGLHQLMQRKDAEITGLKRELEAIKAKLGM
jgi:hypothetical protein